MQTHTGDLACCAAPFKQKEQFCPNISGNFHSEKWLFRHFSFVRELKPLRHSSPTFFFHKLCNPFVLFSRQWLQLPKTILSERCETKQISFTWDNGWRAKVTLEFVTGLHQYSTDLMAMHWTIFTYFSFVILQNSFSLQGALGLYPEPAYCVYTCCFVFPTKPVFLPPAAKLPKQQAQNIICLELYNWSCEWLKHSTRISSQIRQLTELQNFGVIFSHQQQHCFAKSDHSHRIVCVILSEHKLKTVFFWETSVSHHLRNSICLLWKLINKWQKHQGRKCVEPRNVYTQRATENLFATQNCISTVGKLLKRRQRYTSVIALWCRCCVHLSFSSSCRNERTAHHELFLLVCHISHLFQPWNLRTSFMKARLQILTQRDCWGLLWNPNLHFYYKMSWFPALLWVLTSHLAF